MVIPENRVSSKDLAQYKNIQEEKPKVSVTSLYDNQPKWNFYGLLIAHCKVIFESSIQNYILAVW